MIHAAHAAIATAASTPVVAASVLGYIAMVLGAAMVVPQIVRTFRNRALPGVSWISWALTALGCLSWLLYGLRAGEIPQIPGNGLTVIGAVAIALAAPAARGRGLRGLGLLAGAVLLTALAIVLPPLVMGLVAFGIGLSSTVPQTIRSLRGTRGAASAVSVPTWLLYAISQGCWLAFAILHGDPVVFIASVFTIATTMTVSVSELLRRQLASRSAPLAPRPAPAVAARQGMQLSR